jgi:hypothetical protein
MVLLPDGRSVIPFGPRGNCTLELCDIEWSVYKYRPILGVNVMFLVLFAIAMAIHIGLGIRWKSWWFMAFMIMGSLVEMIGYVGRILLFYNPFSFPGFMIQIGGYSLSFPFPALSNLGCQH